MKLPCINVFLLVLLHGGSAAAATATRDEGTLLRRATGLENGSMATPRRVIQKTTSSPGQGGGGGASNDDMAMDEYIPAMPDGSIFAVMAWIKQELGSVKAPYCQKDVETRAVAHLSAAGICPDGMEKVGYGCKAICGKGFETTQATCTQICPASQVISCEGDDSQGPGGASFCADVDASCGLTDEDVSFHIAQANMADLGLISPDVSSAGATAEVMAPFAREVLQDATEELLDVLKHLTVVEQTEATGSVRRVKVDPMTGERDGSQIVELPSLPIHIYRLHQNYRKAFSDDFASQTSNRINIEIDHHFHLRTAQFLKQVWADITLAEIAELPSIAGKSEWKAVLGNLEDSSISLVGMNPVETTSLPGYGSTIVCGSFPFPCREYVPVVQGCSASSGFFEHEEDSCEVLEETWHDGNEQFDCEHYGKDNNCDLHGGQFENDGHTASTACCACSCNIVGWEDSRSLGCDWYVHDPNACTNDGASFENEGHTANTACCVCQQQNEDETVGS